ncbi:hypothetical protein EV188_1011149 [Actinomycetospora succinea]|uniref:Quinol monooxygenase YgiN n=1 Tax=Actinomycetospora succinea TaxID=663603 RepID=A0A4R6VTB8_9PSEU|nr:hypothetical protein [Actinomycetospora succinea]TDQ65897.1 hypothetical protein EV188_1011149 [Actinomycetospora succinea]
MATAVETTFHRVSLEVYDDLLGRLDFRPGGPSEPGCLFHFATPTEDGFRGIDVWESPEAFQRFVSERLGPVLERLGIAAPDVRVLEVHNYLIAPAERRS